MKLAEEVRTLHPVVKTARLQMEQRGGDPDIELTILFAILRELREIKERL